MNLVDKTLFKGTACYYARYRKGYPESLFQYLEKTFNLNPSSRVLDLGTGTGQLALEIAPKVGEVIAVDPEQEMLDEGQLVAQERGIENISWIRASAENLPKDLGHFHLTTIGSAFHWMEREKVLGHIYNLTEKGGGLAIISNTASFHKDSDKVDWKIAVSEVIKKYLGEKRRAGNSYYVESEERWEDLLTNSKFGGYDKFQNAYIQKWTVEELIGFQGSTSFANDRLLGDRAGEFKEELRQKLLALNESGFFTEEVVAEALVAKKL